MSTIQVFPKLPMLGKLPYRHDSRTLKAQAFVNDAVQIPSRHRWSNAVTGYGLDRNDEIGDCAFVSADNAVRTWTANAGQQRIIPVDDVVSSYSALTGFVDGQPETDQGTVWLDLMKFWKSRGIGQSKIDAYALVAHQEPDRYSGPHLSPSYVRAIKRTIWMFGLSPLGVLLPASVQGSSAWTAPRDFGGDNAPGSWGGHAVPAVDYDENGVWVVSWGQLIYVDDLFLSSYMDEAWLALSCDWIGVNNLSPSAFDYAGLLKQAQRLAA